MAAEKPTLTYNPLMDEIEGETAFTFLALARELQSRGKRIISFGIGQPDFVTPEHVREAAKKALDEGFTGYTETAGIPELREAISGYLNSRYGSDVKKDEVIVTTGAKTAIFLALSMYVRPGDEVIIPEPSYYAYAQVVKLFGGKPVYVPMDFEADYGFKLNIERIEAAVTGRTRAVVVNNPHNPTGSIFLRDQLESLLDLARRKNLIIIADEVYDNFIYGDIEFYSLISPEDWRDYIVYINGFSKTFSMTGWRLGYVVARREVIPKMIDLAVTVYSCAPSIAQKAGVAALRGPWEPVKDMIETFEDRARILYKELRGAPGIEAYMPQGAFYMFPRVRGLARAMGVDVDGLVKKLLYDYGILVLPGRAFPDTAGEWHVRISFATNTNDVKEGARMLREIAEQAITHDREA